MLSSAESALKIYWIVKKAAYFMTTSDFTTLEPKDVKSIKALAEEFDCPMEEDNKIYASVLGNLRSSARIKDYLSVLTNWVACRCLESLASLRNTWEVFLRRKPFWGK